MPEASAGHGRFVDATNEGPLLTAQTHAGTNIQSLAKVMALFFFQFFTLWSRNMGPLGLYIVGS
jgi:hypothetical protein